MAWDANEKGNYANLTKQAKEHGVIIGAGVVTVAITAAIGAYASPKFRQA